MEKLILPVRKLLHIGYCQEIMRKIKEYRHGKKRWHRLEGNLSRYRTTVKLSISHLLVQVYFYFCHSLQFTSYVLGCNPTTITRE